MGQPSTPKRSRSPGSRDQEQLLTTILRIAQMQAGPFLVIMDWHQIPNRARMLELIQQKAAANPPL
jgi:hypothetical protein